MQSKLGYLLSGPLPTQPNAVGAEAHTYTTQICNSELSDCIEPLPNDCGATPTLSPQEANTTQLPQSFIHMYQRNCITRDGDGSYIVRFPWKENHPFLPYNLICEHQTRSLASRLGCQPDLLQLYGKIISD